MHVVLVLGCGGPPNWRGAPIASLREAASLSTRCRAFCFDLEKAFSRLQICSNSTYCSSSSSKYTSSSQQQQLQQQQQQLQRRQRQQQQPAMSIQQQVLLGFQKQGQPEQQQQQQQQKQQSRQQQQSDPSSSCKTTTSHSPPGGSSSSSSSSSHGVALREAHWRASRLGSAQRPCCHAAGDDPNDLGGVVVIWLEVDALEEETAEGMRPHCKASKNQASQGTALGSSPTGSSPFAAHQQQQLLLLLQFAAGGCGFAQLWLSCSIEVCESRRPHLPFRVLQANEQSLANDPNVQLIPHYHTAANNSSSSSSSGSSSNSSSSSSSGSSSSSSSSSRSRDKTNSSNHKRGCLGSWRSMPPLWKISGETTEAIMHLEAAWSGGILPVWTAPPSNPEGLADTAELRQLAPSPSAAAAAAAANDAAASPAAAADAASVAAAEARLRVLVHETLMEAARRQLSPAKARQQQQQQLLQQLLLLQPLRSFRISVVRAWRLLHEERESGDDPKDDPKGQQQGPRDKRAGETPGRPPSPNPA
ncbi:hypothetical protein Emag_006586 [Eimeria magna]